jgi:hypothetical protein
LHLLFFLRFLQLGTITITGFIYCWLVWHHTHHFCVYSPKFCTNEELSYVPVLWEYKLVIGACILAFLESYISNAWLIHGRRTPNYRAVCWTTGAVAIVFAQASRAILSNPSTSLYCWFLAVPTSIKASVEERNCTVVVDGYVTLLIATGLTFLIFFMSAMAVFAHRRANKIDRLPEASAVAGPAQREDEKESLLTV